MTRLFFQRITDSCIYGLILSDNVGEITVFNGKIAVLNVLLDTDRGVYEGCSFLLRFSIGIASDLHYAKMVRTRDEGVTTLLRYESDGVTKGKKTGGEGRRVESLRSLRDEGRGIV
jgi:hypothetical protein